MILAGDIGGTHTRLALFDHAPDLTMGVQETYSSKDFSGLLPIVQKFLLTNSASIEQACFGIAGPIHNGKCQATNLPWIVDRNDLGRELKLESVHLLNDLEANAWGLRVLTPEDFFILQEGDSQQTGNAALISAGTGLGEAGLYWDGKEHRPFACEGGHTDFSPRNAMEIELLLYLKKIYGSHVSFERVVSGPGLRHLYEFLIETRREMQPPELKEEMMKHDSSFVISEWGCENRDRGCTRAVEWFSSLYGGEAGNLALKMLARGGLYIGGGIAPRMMEVFKKGGFLKAFKDKGRFDTFLESIPVRIVLNDLTALLGAGEYANRQK
jgi:glucokinase